mgnify:FL=1
MRKILDVLLMLGMICLSPPSCIAIFHQPKYPFELQEDID